MCVIHDPKGPLLYSFNFSSVGGFTEMPYKMTDNTLISTDNIEDLYKSNFAFVGIRFLNLERTPTLWLAFIHSSLICLLAR